MKKIKFDKIAVIGNSNKFIQSIKKNFKYKKIDIFKWRDLSKSIKLKTKYNLIFICGFDFSSYLKNKNEFIKKNIYLPLNILKKISNKTTKIIYINTKSKNNDKITFSRYKYAKQKLAYLLSKNFKKSIIFNANLIMVNNKVSINSNYLSKLFFNILIFFNLIETISIREIFSEIKKNINNSNKDRQKNIDCILLSLPRTQLIDRFLRMVLK